MNRRKIQRVGGNTFSITLPKKWVVSNHLDAGDSLYYRIDSEGNVVFSRVPDAGARRDQVVVTLDENFDRNLTRQYLRGAREIHVELPGSARPACIPAPQRDHVIAKTRDLMGLEVVKETRRSIHLQVVPAYPAEEIKEVLKRLLLLTAGMLHDVLTCLAQEDCPADLLKSIVARDNEVDRWYFLLVRHVRTYFRTLPREHDPTRPAPLTVLDYRVIAQNIEDIGDKCEGIAKNLVSSRLPPRLFPEIARFARLVHENYQRTIEAFLANDAERAYVLIQKKADFVNETQKLASAFEMAATRTQVGLPRALDAFRALQAIYENAADICDLIG